MRQSSIEINSPADATIVMYINEPDGTVSETPLWGPGADESLRGAVRAAILDQRHSNETSNSTKVDFGRIEVDDSISANVGGETIDASEIGGRIVAFITAAVKNAVSGQLDDKTGENDDLRPV